MIFVIYLLLLRRIVCNRVEIKCSKERVSKAQNQSYFEVTFFRAIGLFYLYSNN